MRPLPLSRLTRATRVGLAQLAPRLGVVHGIASLSAHPRQSCGSGLGEAEKVLLTALRQAGVTDDAVRAREDSAA